MAFVTPARAYVAPRIVSAETGNVFLAVDELAEILDSGCEARIAICGSRGSGKSTALAHLAAVFSQRDDLLVTEQYLESEVRNQLYRVVVFSGHPEAHSYVTHRWQMAEWGQDEAMDYLLGRFPDQCAKVMAKLNSQTRNATLPKHPFLWTLLLDLMAKDPTIRSFAAGLDAIVSGLKTNLTRYEQLELVAAHQTRLLRSWIAVIDATETFTEVSGRPFQQLDDTVARFANEESILLPVATDFVCAQIKDGTGLPFLQSSVDADLLKALAYRALEDQELLIQIQRMVEDTRYQAMAASIMCRTSREWRPNIVMTQLSHGNFENANWDGQEFAHKSQTSFLLGASLRHASLRGTRFAKCQAAKTDFSNANLEGATFAKSNCCSAKFNAAVLRDSMLCGAILDEARFMGADCTGANFQGSSLKSSNFQRAKCVKTNFYDADFRQAKVVEADFTNAIFEKSNLEGVDFRQADLTDASFRWAKMMKCNLEGQCLPRANFQSADLRNALMSDSVIHAGNFQGANLRDAGLGNVDWEGSDLSNADLRGVTFHFGSTRSGLVGSPYPSHGTRTGFYTDDFFDQPFKSPEEIRSANLRRVDLRGCRIEGVDFYLVDLRGAIMDGRQYAHVERCGAILVSRV